MLCLIYRTGYDVFVYEYNPVSYICLLRIFRIVVIILKALKLEKSKVIDMIDRYTQGFVKE